MAKWNLFCTVAKKACVVLGLCAVIHRRGVNVGDLLVEASFAGSDFADFREQVVEVGLVEDGTVFQAFLVEHIPTGGEVAQDADLPLAKLGGAGGVHPEADGDDGVEVVEGGEVAFAVAGSIPEFPDNCHLGQFPTVENIL